MVVHIFFQVIHNWLFGTLQETFGVLVKLVILVQILAVFILQIVPLVLNLLEVSGIIGLVLNSWGVEVMLKFNVKEVHNSHSLILK